MTLTNEQLDRLEKAIAIITPGDDFIEVDRDEAAALVGAYRTAMRVRREIERALLHHDMDGIRNGAHQLPTDGRPLWEKD